VDKKKYGLLASRPPVNSSSLAEVRLSSVRQGSPEAVGDVVPNCAAQLHSDEPEALCVQPFQDGNSQAFAEIPQAAEGSSESTETRGTSRGDDAASEAPSRTSRKSQNLVVLRASLGNEPRNYIMGMQCVCAYLGRAPNETQPLDSEIMPLLRSLPSENLLSLGTFIKTALPHGKWNAAMRSSQVIPRLTTTLTALCGAYREWFADEPDDVTRVVIDLGGGRW